MEGIVVLSHLEWYTSQSNLSAASSSSSESVYRRANIVKRKKAIRYRDRAAAPYHFRYSKLICIIFSVFNFFFSISACFPLSRIHLKV